ncbi:MAG TPA: hypothetical protein QF572_18055 [Vicinamibacterales bacterium]|nr:hypothetical protein [Vicinamibacterales bacterium]HJN46075.1 hypothetical protein [Vicinamibacterales bacterium]
MTRLYFRTISGVFALVMLAPTGAVGQDAPRTPWGDPDLQGTYTNKTITPLERPEALGDKEFLTAEEVASQEQARLDRNEELLYAPPQRTVAGGNVGGYNNFWLDGGTRPTGRTSLIFDPPDGRMPARTPEGAQRKTAHDAAFPVAGPFDTWEDLELNDRCLVWSAGPPMLPSAYNNNFMILQTPGYVVINVEMIHDTRFIPIDGRDHLPTTIRQWHGDARGHWEGDTLVVETSNLRRTEANAAAVGGDPVLLRAANGGTDDTITVTERFTRADDETVHYEFTIEDPTQWTRQFSGEFPFVALPPEELMYEYACHEGNYSMINILGGERALEKATATDGQP